MSRSRSPALIARCVLACARSAPKTLWRPGARPRDQERATGWLGLSPRSQESLERLDAAEVAGFGKRSIERRDVSDRGQLEVRRSQERSCRDAREVGVHARQHQIERCREGFGCQRQRVEHLARHAGRSKYFTSDVHVRQSLSHDKCGVDRATPAHPVGPRASRAAQRQRLPLPDRARRGPAPSWRNDQQRKTAIDWRLVADLLDPGEHPMHAFMKRPGQHRVGDDDIEALEARYTRERDPSLPDPCRMVRTTRPSPSTRGGDRARVTARP